jgi:DNA-binding protein Fis
MNDNAMSDITKNGSPDASLYDMEKQAIILALQKANYNQTRASRILGITRDTLRYKMKKYSLHKNVG